MNTTTTTIRRFAYVGAVAVSLLSCNRDNNEDNSAKTDISSLSKVEFADQAPKLVSSKKTGETRYNPANNTTEFEYLNEVEKTHTVSPLSFIDGNNTDVIYPGSILRGSSFIEGTYDPLVLSTPYNDVTVSVSLRGANYPVKDISKPVLSEIRKTTNGLVAKNKSDIDYSFVPAYVNYFAHEVNTSESFNKALNIHAKASILGGILSAKFNYKDSYSSSKSSKYVMVKLNQTFYNVSIDSKHYTEWFNGNVPTKDFGSHEPVYVSSVDYGRAAYLLIETNQSAEEVKKMVSGAVDFSFKVISGSVGASYERSMQKLFSDSKIRVVIVGGPARLAGQVNSYESFLEFIRTPNIDALISSAAPISYKVRRLKDNTEVEVKSTIKVKELEYKKS